MTNVVSLTKQRKPLEAYRGDAPYVFVSYAHQDKEAVYIELVRLKKLGFNVWYDEGISPGSRWSDDLAERIANCALFLYYVTPRSATSTNCQDEASYVLEAGNPFLAVHLEETELPPGLQLRMGPRQAILRYELEADAYQKKLYDAIAAQSTELVRATVDLTQGFRLGDFKIGPLTGAVTDPDGKAYHIEPKVMDVFVHLAEHAGDLVTRDQLLDAVWSGQPAADELLTRAISELRRVLHDGGDAKYIETVPKRGYRLIGDIRLPEGARREMRSQTAIPARASTITPEDIEPIELRQGRSKRQKIVVIGFGLLVTILTGVTMSELLPVPAPPVVSDYTQLTKSQVIFPPAPSPLPLVADASRIYFNGIDSIWFGIRQLSQMGGEAVRMETPFDDEELLVNPLAMTPDGSQLLLSAFVPGLEETPSLWTWPVVGGNPRRLGEGGGAAYSPDGSKLLYSDGYDEIYLANPDLSDSRLLVTAPGKVYWLRFSPDGRRIRFTADTESQALFEMAADGTGLHRVLPDWNTVDHCCGSWTPDGNYYVFQAVQDNRTQIWAIRERQGIFGRRQSVPVQITDSALDFRRPTITSQGNRIFAVGWQLRGELVSYDSEIGRFVPITDLESLSADWLTYSRDEEWIAYTSYPEGDLWRSKSDGTDRRQLTFPPMRAGDPVWSPDGKNLAFSGKPPEQKWKVYIVSAEGGRPRAITGEDRGAWFPAWSPDGETMAFSAPRTDRIQILDLASGTVSDLQGSEGLYWPVWSPDGRFLAVSSDDYLQLFDISTGQSEKLAKVRDFGFHRWAKDSQSIYYVDPFYRGGNRSVYRVNIRDKTTEKIVTIGDTRVTWGGFGQWIGITPDGAPMLLRDLSIHHIYALDWLPD